MTILGVTRREFVAALGSAVAWPLVARAQQGQGIRLIGVLMSTAAGDEQSIARYTAFLEGLRASG